MPEVPTIPGYMHVIGPVASVFGTPGYFVYEGTGTASIPDGFEQWPVGGNNALIIRPRKAPPEPPKPTDGILVPSGGDVTSALRAAQPGSKVYLERGGTYSPIVDTTLRPHGVTLAAWGTGKRPVIDGGSTGCLKLWTVDGFTVDSIAFVGNGNPDDTGAGVNLMGVRDFTICDSEISGNRMGLTVQAAGDRRSARVSIVRCYVHDNAPTRDGVDGSGIFSGATDGLVIDHCVIDRNGRSDAYAGSMRNHGCYIRADSGPATITGNIFANSASHGLQARSGGDVAGNLFFDNPIHMSYGLVNGTGPIHLGGVKGKITGNVFSGTRPLAGKPRGWAIEAGNVAELEISDNIMASDHPYDARWGTFPAAIKLDVLDLDASNPHRGKGVGIKRVTIANNMIQWPYARLWVNPDIRTEVEEVNPAVCSVAATREAASRRLADGIREAASK